MFIKLLQVLLLGWIGFSLMKRFKENNPSASNNGKGQKMIACDVCDTHVPESDVVVQPGKHYCSKEHAE